MIMSEDDKEKNAAKAVLAQLTYIPVKDKDGKDKIFIMVPPEMAKYPPLERAFVNAFIAAGVSVDRGGSAPNHFSFRRQDGSIGKSSFDTGWKEGGDYAYLSVEESARDQLLGAGIPNAVLSALQGRTPAALRAKS
jgi:hypothetical protein